MDDETVRRWRVVAGVAAGILLISLDRGKRLAEGEKEKKKKKKKKKKKRVDGMGR